MLVTQLFSAPLSFVRNRVVDRAAGKLCRLAAAVSLWCARRRQWQALMDLDDRLLRDVGLTRAQAVKAATRPFRIRASE